MPRIGTYIPAIISVTLLLSACEQLEKLPIAKALDASPRHTSSFSLTRHETEQKAQAALQEKHFAEAETLYNTLLKDDPLNRIYLSQRAEAQVGQGDYASAQEAYEKLLFLNPDNVIVREKRAIAYLYQGDLSSATNDFLKVLERDALRWQSINALGIVYALQGDTTQAREYFTSALQVAEDSPVVLNNIGLTLALEKNYPAAVDALEKAIQRFQVSSPKRRRAELNLSLIYGVAGNTENAEILLRKHLPDYQAYNNLAVYARLAKNDSLAAQFIQRAIKASPDFYEKAVDTLKELEGSHVL